MAAKLVLETGHVFHGNSIGVPGITVGEVVFNTALTGYQEIISDPSYTQQIITFTYPHIGNTGINPQDFQASSVHAAGIVVKEFAKFVSNWRATNSLQEYLQQQNVVGISGVDTRGITKILSKLGSLRGCIIAANTQQEDLNIIESFSGLKGLDLTAEVTCSEVYTVASELPLHVVLVDFGVKQDIITCLVNLGAKVTVVPARTNVTDILKLEPDGILLSNGPGDPQACSDIIANIKLLLQANIPIFGICLGHQLLALALNAKTYKMNFGHHGANHPVQDIFSKRIFITSQNHGFAVQETTLPKDIQVTHRSLFDQTLQGFKHKTLAIFGFQGHPEAAPGPHDAKILFADFMHAVKVQHAKTS